MTKYSIAFRFLFKLDDCFSIMSYVRSSIYVKVKTTGLLLFNLHYKYDNFWVTKIKYMVCKVQDYDILYNNADDQSIYERLPFYSHRKQLHDRHNFIKRWRG